MRFKLRNAGYKIHLLLNFFMLKNKVEILKLQVFKKLIKAIFLGLLYCYKFCISPLLPKTCRYLPTCSAYARECFKVHKLPFAFWLTLKRLISCNPFSKKEMVDEVPRKEGR